MSVRMGAPILTIAKYTLKGYVRERVLLVVLIFAFMLMLSSYVLAPMAVGAQQKIIVDIGLASISIFGILLVVLLGASSYSREKERGILPGILAKPIDRVDFVLGKYLGTVGTVLIVMLFMTAVYTFVMMLSDATLNRVIFVAIFMSVIEIGLVTAIMSFFSSFTSPLLSSFFTLCVFISGHLSKDLLEFAAKFGNAPFRAVSNVGYYLLPNLSVFNVRPEAVHNLPLYDNYVFTATAYGLFYTGVLLFLSSLVFRRRDVV